MVYLHRKEQQNIAHSAKLFAKHTHAQTPPHLFVHFLLSTVLLSMPQFMVSSGKTSGDALEREMYLLRRMAAKRLVDEGLDWSTDMYFCSLSTRTIVYKGMTNANVGALSSKCAGLLFLVVLWLCGYSSWWCDFLYLGNGDVEGGNLRGGGVPGVRMLGAA